MEIRIYLKTLGKLLVALCLLTLAYVSSGGVKLLLTLLLAGVILIATVHSHQSDKLTKERTSQLKMAGEHIQQKSNKLQALYVFLEAVIHHIPHVIYVRNRQGKFLMANSAASKQFGMAPEELLNLTPEGQAKNSLALSDCEVEVIDSGKEQFKEEVSREKDQSRFYQSSYVPLLDPNTKAPSVLVISIDITREKRAEEKFHLTLENSHTPLLMTDAQGIITMVNKAATNLFGYESGELEGQVVEVLIPKKHIEQHKQHRRDYFQAPRPLLMRKNANLHGLTKRGHQFPIDVRISPLLTSKGMFTLCAMVDLTEKKQLERFQDELIATVSHEVRTPLTSIVGSLGLVLGMEADNLSPQARDLLKMAKKNGDHLVHLTNDMLDMEKIQKGKMTFILRRVDMLEVAKHAMEMNRGYGVEQNIKFSLQSNLKKTRVLVDQSRITQVLINLLSNATKFSPPGGTVILDIQRQKNKLKISISDQGPGIAADHHDRIFQRFVQVEDKQNTNRKGTGLGLPLVREILKLHGSEIHLDSKEGEGSTFYFYLSEEEEG